MPDKIVVMHVLAWGRADIRTVENSAAALSTLVGGYLEVFYLPLLTTDPMNSVIGLCDDDGWGKKHPAPNIYGPILSNRGPLAGDVVLVRAKPDGDFGSLTGSDIAALTTLLTDWLARPHVYITSGTDPTDRA